jgi:hypothetical protein
MCGGFEKPGDGISLDFETGSDGEYELSLVYGKCNDGPSPADRRDAKVIMTLDGKEETISLPNTVKSEYTDKYTFLKNLKAGTHNIKLMHGDGTFVVDSLLVRKTESKPDIYSNYEKENSAYLMIAPGTGYYRINGEKSLYLKTGLNYIESKDSGPLTAEYDSGRRAETIDFGNIALSGTAEISSSGSRDCITGIDSESGKAEFKFIADKAGMYALTVTYSNNEEHGVHAYNVDLIEEYITIGANGKNYELWCVNTMSESTFAQAVAYITLKEGENIIALYNDGHNSFNGRVSSSPAISGISFCPAQIN